MLRTLPTLSITAKKPEDGGSGDCRRILLLMVWYRSTVTFQLFLKVASTPRLAM